MKTSGSVNKRDLLKKIRTHLSQELELFERAARAAHEEATDEQNKAENKYDTRGLEAAYLARGQSRQAAEIAQAIHQLEGVEARLFGPDEAIDVGALVELDSESGNDRFVYFIAPCAGGTEVVLRRREIFVITPKSPLGQQLLGKRQGDRMDVEIGGVRNHYRVVSVI